jgi:hypothetical protein
VAALADERRAQARRDLRDEFAMASLALGGEFFAGLHPIEIASRAFEIADAMLAARGTSADREK